VDWARFDDASGAAAGGAAIPPRPKFPW